MNIVRGAAVFAICAAVAIALWRPGETGGFLGGLEGRLLDARYAVRGERSAPDTVAILALDDAALASLDSFPPSRDVLATALVTAKERGATSVSFDLLLVDRGVNPDSLEIALAEYGDTILAVSRAKSTKPPDTTVEGAIARSAFAVSIGSPKPGLEGLLGPHPQFAQKATLAHVNVGLESDGALRRIPMAMVDDKGVALPSLPLTAARQSAGLERSEVALVVGESIKFGAREIPLDPQNAAILNFFGKRGTVPTYSILDATEAPLEGRAVFIGATAEGFGDHFSTPFDTELPGVEALATMTANLLSGETLKRNASTWMVDLVLAICFAALAVWTASRKSLSFTVLSTAGVWLAGLAVLYLTFLISVWLDGTTLVSALGVATLAGTGARRTVNRRRAENMARYQSPLMVEMLSSQSIPEIDGRMQKVAVLFVDAADFTPRSARIGPEATGRFLKAFHSSVERAATASMGMIDQYAGDGVLILFGVPHPSANDAANALKCADLLFEEIAGLNGLLREEGEPAMNIRVGMHYGEVLAAVLGGDKQRHVGVAGDVVNAASRLQELGKIEGASLVVSSDLLDVAGRKAHKGFRHLGPRDLRGRDKPLDLWARDGKPHVG